MNVYLEDVAQVLRSNEDVCSAMSEIGFELFGYDEDYPDDYYFMSKDNKNIVFFSAVNCSFYVYGLEGKYDL